MCKAHPEVSKKARSHGDDLRGASQLAVEATRGVSELVQAIQIESAAGPAILGRPLEGPAKLFTGIVHGMVRGITSVVGATIDVALEHLAPLLGASVPGVEREAILGALNGVLGDYLVTTKNPLAIQMRLRSGGEGLELTPEALRAVFPAATSKLVVLLHGSCATDLMWLRNTHDHGVAIAADLGASPIYLHYNSGLHISANGRELAGLLEQLVAAWPIAVTQLVLIGHSMGGLVARSACHVGEDANHSWRHRLDALVTIGAPHHGAPLERGGSSVQLLLGVSRFSAPFARLARVRSAGITDLRYGNVLDEHWEGRDRFEIHDDPRRVIALPEKVRCFALAGSLSREPGPNLRGDGMVPVDSALGEHAMPTLALAFPEVNKRIVYSTGHLDLLDPPVYDIIRAWLVS